jgi:hypothetical protein
MGRTAKLKASRRSEKADQFAADVKILKQVASSTTPAQMTAHVGPSLIDYLVPGFRQKDAYKSLCLKLSIWSPHLIRCFHEIIGMTISPIAVTQDWERQQANITALALEPWTNSDNFDNWGNMKALIDLDDPVAWMLSVITGMCQGHLPGRLQMARAQGLMNAKDLDLYAMNQAAIGYHVEQQANLTQGRLLFDAGALVLHYSRGNELCLSFRSMVGFLSHYPVAETRCLNSSVKQMRCYINHYDGRKFYGHISSHASAARLCELVGLKVEGRYAWLRPAPTAPTYS